MQTAVKGRNVTLSLSLLHLYDSLFPLSWWPGMSEQIDSSLWCFSPNRKENPLLCFFFHLLENISERIRGISTR